MYENLRVEKDLEFFSHSVETNQVELDNFVELVSSSLPDPPGARLTDVKRDKAPPRPTGLF